MRKEYHTDQPSATRFLLPDGFRPARANDGVTLTANNIDVLWFFVHSWRKHYCRLAILDEFAMRGTSATAMLLAFVSREPYPGHTSPRRVPWLVASADVPRLLRMREDHLLRSFERDKVDHREKFVQFVGSGIGCAVERRP
jgi:hypothetical protein